MSKFDVDYNITYCIHNILVMRIFNQIRKVLIKQAKFEDYFKYAIGEIILVVIGILIALQINNLNADRKTDKERLLTLEILHQSFEKNKVEIENTLEDFSINIDITDLRIRNTGPNIGNIRQSLIDSIRIIDVVKLELSNKLNSNILIDTKSISLLSGQVRNLLLEYNSIYSKYKNSENNLNILQLKLRDNHQKYIAIINEDSTYRNSDNYRGITFDSDYILWLRDRENQNISVESKWKMEQAIIDLNMLHKANDLIIKTLLEEIDES